MSRHVENTLRAVVAMDSVSKNKWKRTACINNSHRNEFRIENLFLFVPVFFDIVRFFSFCLFDMDINGFVCERERIQKVRLQSAIITTFFLHSFLLSEWMFLCVCVCICALFTTNHMLGIDKSVCMHAFIYTAMHQTYWINSHSKFVFSFLFYILQFFFFSFSRILFDFHVFFNSLRLWCWRSLKKKSIENSI